MVTGSERAGRGWPAPGTILPPLFAAAVALSLCLAAMQPGVAFWDTAEFQTVPPILGTAHPTGYPTYVILGWIASALLTPFGDPAFRMNLFAGISVAAATGLTTMLVGRLTGQAIVGAAAGIGLAASPLAWRVGTHAEPHALHLALVALLVLLLAGWELARRDGSPRADRWLVAAAAAFGLSAGNHSLTLLLAPPVAVYVLAVQPSIIRRPRLIGACLAALVGVLAVVYLELPIRAGVLRAPLVYGRPETWEGFWYIALAQQFQGAVSNPFGDLSRKLGDLASLATQKLGVLTIMVPAAFVVTLRRFPRFALLTGLAAIATWIFSASYANADISRYYLGPLLMAWIWLGILGATAADILGAEARAFAPRSALASGCLIAAGLLAVLMVLPTVSAIPVRHQHVDLSDDRGAEVWLDAALERIAHNSVVVSWWSYSTTLWYAQFVEGRRTDMFVVDDRTRLDLEMGEATDVIATYLGKRPVFLIRANAHDLRLVTDKYIVRAGTGPAAEVYEVVRPVTGGS